MPTALMSAPSTQGHGRGFDDAAMDSQAIFRAVMNAIAEPGIVRPLDASVLAGLDAPSPLTPASAAILLALADYETPVWLDATLNRPEVATYLRFHTGCPLTAEPGGASIAVITDGADLNSLDDFSLGTLDYPDRSTTLVVQVASLIEGAAWHLSGPGIATSRTIHLSPVHAALPAALATNRALFPCGVDILFTDGAAVLGLPRSTVVTET